MWSTQRVARGANDSDQSETLAIAFNRTVNDIGSLNDSQCHSWGRGRIEAARRRTETRVSIADHNKFETRHVRNDGEMTAEV